MAKLTIIVGMPGSGKSQLCDRLAKESLWPGNAFHDFTLTAQDDRRAGLKSLAEVALRLKVGQEDCVVDETHLGVASFQQHFLSFCGRYLDGVDQRWIFFDKSEESQLNCINNVFMDAHKKGRTSLSRFEAMLNQLTDYTGPPSPPFQSQEVHRVRPCKSPDFATLSEAIAALRVRVEELREEARKNGTA